MDDAGEGVTGEEQGEGRKDPAEEHAGAGVGVDESVKIYRYFILFSHLIAVDLRRQKCPSVSQTNPSNALYIFQCSYVCFTMHSP